MTKIFHMNPDLMGSACLKSAFYLRNQRSPDGGFGLDTKAIKEAVIGNGMTPMFRFRYISPGSFYDGLFLPVMWRSRETAFYASFFRLGLISYITFIQAMDAVFCELIR